MLLDLVSRNRSYRRFYQEESISRQTLEELVELARLCPSSRNVQSLRFHLSADPESNARIFPTLGWAGYLKDWPGPKEGERPTAYITILGDKNLAQKHAMDTGITAQTMLLGAVERGLGGCMIYTVKRKELKAILHIPDNYDIGLVVAFGKPKEEIVLDPLGDDGDIKYWRDNKQVHHVPKRSLQDLIVSF